jgi:hypothetical protein
MSASRITVNNMNALPVPDPLSPAITRPRQLVEAVLAQSMRETGTTGRAALAWPWALTGTRPSPITLSLPVGQPPSRSEILTEASAEPDSPTAPHGVPTDFSDQLGEARHILSWLAGSTDEIPVDDEQRGRFVGARDDYARTDADIRQVRDHARRGLDTFDLPKHMDPATARNPWRWDVSWMNAAWLRGVRDLLDWVLGDRMASPLCGRTVGLPTAYDLTYEEGTADHVVLQGRPAGLPVDPDAQPPPQYGEGLQTAIRWLRGQSTTSPVDQHGCGAYVACPGGGADAPATMQDVSASAASSARPSHA